MYMNLRRWMGAPVNPSIELAFVVIVFAIKYLFICCNLWWASAETTNARQNSSFNCQKTCRHCGAGDKWSAGGTGSGSVACQTVCLLVWWHWLIHIPDFGAFYSSSKHVCLYVPLHVLVCLIIVFVRKLHRCAIHTYIIMLYASGDKWKDTVIVC